MSRLIRSDKTSKSTGSDIEDHLPFTRENITAHLKACQNIAVDHARRVFTAYLKDLDEAFHVEIDTAKSNQDVSELSGIQRLFRRNRDELGRYYYGYIGEGFVKFKKKELNTVLENSIGSELMLVDNDELEETITISTITQKLDESFAEPIWALNQRFAILNDGEQVVEANNPSAPIQLCESLRRALRLVPLTYRAKATAYRVYEQGLMGLVQCIVEDTNEYLRKAGVLPNLKYAPSRSSASRPGASQAPSQDSGTGTTEQHAAEPPTESFAEVGEPDPNQPTEQYQSSLIQAIRNLQQSMGGGVATPARERRATSDVIANMVAEQGQDSPVSLVFSGLPAGVGAPRGEAGSGAPFALDHPQLMVALQGVQASNSSTLANEAAGGQTMAAMNIQNVLQGLAQKIQTDTVDGKSARVTDGDMNVIDLVGMVFEFMLSDENLPVSVKAVLSYLHTPFLKLAFMDPGFFEQSEHPARLLLNNLADAGSRWVGNDGTDQYDMFAKINGIVDRVLKEFVKDVKIITELLLEFDGYVKGIARRQDLVEKRATEKVQGEERLREAKIRVNEEVMSRTDNKELPSAVLLLLLQPWSDYLSFTLLRYGEDASRWVRALEVIDDLIWAVQPKESDDDPSRQQTIASGLVNEFRVGLDTISYDPVKGNQLLESIGDLIDMARMQKQVEPAPSDVRSELEKTAEQKAGVILEPESQLSAEEEKMVERLRMIEFGTWFEFEDGKRLKVAWFNARTSNYMMVDQLGKKVDMLSGLELAKALLEKRTKIIAGSSKPFFERALENIFQKLNEEASEQSGENRSEQ